MAVELKTSIVRFVATGLLATAVHAGIFFALIQAAGRRPAHATVVAFACAFVVSYGLNRSWTFQSRGRHRAQLPRFLLIGLTGSALNYLIMRLATEGLQLAPVVGLVAVVVSVPPVTFAASRWWGFR